MESRMEKYNTEKTSYKSRTQKHQDLYNDVKVSNLSNFDVNSNESVIETNAKKIDVNKLSEILDKRYNDDAPKRKSIEVPTYEDDPITEQPLVETKEYDINAILEKAKQGKNVDYNKERLKKVRDAQYEILNNLDLEIQKVEDVKKSSQRKLEEDTLMNLINTITQIETKNKEEARREASDETIDIFAGLEEETPAEGIEMPVPREEKEEYQEVEEELKNDDEEEIEEEIEEEEEVVEEPAEEKVVENEQPDDTHDDYVKDTLSKLDIDLSSYEDFSDVSKRDISVVIIKIAIFIIVIGLVIGAIYVLNILLDLGLF